MFFNYGKIQNQVCGTHSDTGAGLINKFYITNRFTNQVGANARFGYFIEDYFLYALVGIQYQESKYFVTANQTTNGGDVYDYSYSTSKKKTSALSTGLGLERPIADHFKIGLEMKYTKYPKKHFYYALGDAEKTNLTTTFKYRLLAFSVRLSYVF